MNFRKSRFVGCLLGKAVGDAVGAPVEFKGPEDCQAYIKAHVQPLDFTGVVREYEGPFPYGQYTDDTQLARELVFSLVDSGGSFDPENFASRVVEIFRPGGMVGSGRATARAAKKLSEGVPWQRAGTPAPAAGNGSAMRAAPLGLIYIERHNSFAEALCTDARNQSLVTHTDRRSVAGSIAMAGATALLVSGVEPESPYFLGTLAEWVAPYDLVLAQGLFKLSSWAKLDLPEAYTEIHRLGLPEDFTSKWDPGISPFVTTGVLWAMYSFLHTPDDFKDTLCTAIWPGGDVDTTAAMAGALSGVFGGLECIPSEMLQPITDRGEWEAPDLIELAMSLEELC